MHFTSSFRARRSTEAEMSSLQKDLFKKHFPPLPHGATRSSGSGLGLAKRRKRDYSPLPSTEFFDRCQDVATIPGNCFRVYFKGNSGPVLLLLHGGGHSALSWAVFAVAVNRLVECEVVAVDLRGHGESVTSDDSNMAASTLVNDIAAITDILFRDREIFPPIVMVGHSMGGAIATRAAASGNVNSLVGLVVIDVVEGTAMESLNSMQSYLKDRPRSFSSLRNAVEWSIRSGQLKNAESARVSVPGQVRSVANNSGREIWSQHSNILPSGPIREEEEDERMEGKERGGGTDGGNSKVSSSSNTDTVLSPQCVTGGDVAREYVWRVNLKETECYWQGWFSGLSKLFLTLSVPKMLILAGVDRLDKELTIGQMQGRFQMQVMSGCGHSVHEDAPDKVAVAIAGFLTRHKFARRKSSDNEMR